MFLTNEKIRELTVGAAAVYEEENGLRFAKCTADQLAAWKEAAPWIYANAVGSTGVRMDFATDSDFVTFTTGEYGKYEIKINGMIRAQYAFREADGHERKNTFTVQLEKGVNRVTLSLPSHGAGGIIASVEIADGAFIERHRFDSRLLFLGDSITQGWNSKYDSMSYAWLVSDALNAESIIQGIGGAVFAPATVLPMDFAPDTVVIAYGTNDWGLTTWDKFSKNCREFYKILAEQYPKANIYALAPIWRKEVEEVRECCDFRQVASYIHEVTKPYSNIKVIDCFDFVPKEERYFADFKLHPNDKGFEHYGKNLIVHI